MTPVLLGARRPACHIPGMADDPEISEINPPKAPKVPDTAQGRARPKPREIGGPNGLEPTRYGDWEVGGRCTDF
jgi:hypothetical protein